MIYKQNKTRATKAMYKEKKRAFARIQTYSLTAPCTWNQLWDYFATWLLNDVIALQTPSHHTYTNISGPTKFASCYDSRAIRTWQNYKINLLRRPYGLCFARINLSIESCFVLLLGCFLGDTLQKILLCFVVVKVFRSRKHSFKWKRSLIFFVISRQYKKIKNCI